MWACRCILVEFSLAGARFALCPMEDAWLIKSFDGSDSNSSDSAPNINSLLHPTEIKSWSWRPFFLTGRRWCGSAGGWYLFMFTISMKDKSQFWFSSSGAADKIEASHFVPHKRCCWYCFPKRHKLPLKLCFCTCLEASWNFTRIW